MVAGVDPKFLLNKEKNPRENFGSSAFLFRSSLLSLLHLQDSNIGAS